MDLKHGDIHVWYGTVSQTMSWDELRLLSANERFQAERFMRHDDRMRYISAHAAVRRMLASYLCVDSDALVLGRADCPRCGSADHGPPRVIGHGGTLRYSLSHAGSRYAIAFTAGADVGIDIEARREIDVAGLTRVILAPAEEEAIARLDAADAQAFLLRAWTRKEAFSKALGIGLAADLRRLDVQPMLFGPVIVHGGVSNTDARSWAIADLSEEPSWFAAVAVEGQRIGTIITRNLQGRTHLPNEFHSCH